MDYKQVVDWVKMQESRGYNKEQISQYLLQQNYSKKDIRWIIEMSKLKYYPSKSQIIFLKIGRILTILLSSGIIIIWIYMYLKVKPLIPFEYKVKLLLFFIFGFSLFISALLLGTIFFYKYAFYFMRIRDKLRDKFEKQ